MPGIASSRSTMSSQRDTASSSNRPVASRAVGCSQICLLLMLVMGFLLIFSYQAEIHTVLADRNGSGEPVSAGGNRSLKNPTLGGRRSDAKVEKKRSPASRSKLDKMVVADRKLESKDSLSKGAPAPGPPPRPKKNRYDQKRKDSKEEAYMPLVESVQSNVLSKNFQLVIKVLSVSTNHSLARCLTSLSLAEYAKDTVDLHIYIDHFEIDDIPENRRRLLEAGTVEKTGTGEIKKNAKAEQIRKKDNKNKKSARELVDEDSPEDSPAEVRVLDRVDTGGSSVKRSDWKQVENRLNDAREVLKFAESFEWKFGKKVIHYRTQSAGSQSQWVDAWWPSSDDEFAFFVEDDTELSPLFYRYSRALIATYYYNRSHNDESLFGISLQRPQIVPGRNGRPVKVDDRTRLFKYQMIGLYGQIFFPKPWKEFRMWYDTKRSHSTKPIVEGMLTTDWYQKFGEKLFTPWFVKFAYNRGYFNLYTNFLRDRVLSVSHRNKRKKYAGCDSVLIYFNGTYDIDLWHMAAGWHINKYDFCFKDVRAGRFSNSPLDASWVLDSTQINRKIVMISTFAVPRSMVRNWLCRVRKLGIANYVFVGEDIELLRDLARRGHASMRVEPKDSSEEPIEFEVNAIATALNLGLDVWFIRADTVWVGNPLNLISTQDVDIIGLENSLLDLLYIKGTETTNMMWNTLKDELSHVPENVSRIDHWDRVRGNFVKACLEEEKIRTGTLDQVTVIDGEALNSLPSTSEGGSTDAQVLRLSGLRYSRDWEIKKKLRELKSWNLDEDLACAELVC